MTYKLLNLYRKYSVAEGSVRRFYQLATIFLMGFILLTPIQIDRKIVFAILIYSVSLLPMFFMVCIQKLKEKDSIYILFMLFILVNVLSTIFSIQRERSLFASLLVGCFLVVFSTSGIIFKSLQEKMILVVSLTSITVLLSAISLYNTLFRHYVNLETQGVSFMWVYFGQNHLASLLVITFPLTFFLVTWLKKGNSIAGISLLWFMVISLVFTFSRVSLVIFAILILVSLFLSNKRLAQLAKISAVTVAVVLLITAFVASFNKLGVPKYWEFLDNGRLVYWQQALTNFSFHPILGSGPDSFGRASATISKDMKLRSVYTHNIFLQTLSDLGILGLTTYLLLLFKIISKAIKVVKGETSKGINFYLLLFVSLSSVFVSNLFNFDLQLPSIAFLFWFLLGNIFEEST